MTVRLQVIPGRRGVPETALVRTSALTEPWLEVAAIADEAHGFAAKVVRAARFLQTAAAAGQLLLIGTLADQLETASHRAEHRSRKAGLDARARLGELETYCPDEIAAPGHGRAA